MDAPESTPLSQGPDLDNPFLSPALLLDWHQLQSSSLQRAFQSALEKAQAALHTLESRPLESCGYPETFGALEQATEALDVVHSRTSVLESLRDQPDLRAVLREWKPKLAAFQASIPLREELWKRLKHAAKSPSGQGLLSEAQIRYQEETLAAFRDQGADLNPPEKARLKVLEETLTQETQAFAECVLDATNAWEWVIQDKALLSGVPEVTQQALCHQASVKGLGSPQDPRWVLNLHAPCVGPVLRYAHQREVRQKIWEAYQSIGGIPPYDNTQRVRTILALRQEKAQLLGHSHFPDWVLARRMAQKGAKALGFIEDLHQAVQPAFQDAWAQLETFAKTLKGQNWGAEGLQPWDLAYVMEAYRQKTLYFDAEALRPYFELNAVMQGLWKLAHQLFGLRIEPVQDAPPAWDDPVKLYAVADTQGHAVGYFYTDWHPRPNKRSGAWMSTLEVFSPSALGPSKRPRMGYICGNFTLPIPGQPVLLTHEEVTTLFHEFGHLLHHLLSQVEIEALSGTRVAWDFVELPSQLMENFCWERESLDLFARHHLTGEAIPEDLLSALQASRCFLEAIPFMRQLAQSKMDLLLHLQPARYQQGDLDAALLADLKGYLLPYSRPPRPIVRQFLHLFSDPVGYAAGYYSYKWAEVLEADAFMRFQKEGLLNPKVGQALAETILSQGNLKPAQILFRAFMGRDPQIEPLLVRSGLKSPQAKAPDSHPN